MWWVQVDPRIGYAQLGGLGLIGAALLMLWVVYAWRQVWLANRGRVPDYKPGTNGAEGLAECRKIASLRGTLKMGLIIAAVLCIGFLLIWRFISVWAVPQ